MLFGDDESHINFKNAFIPFEVIPRLQNDNLFKDLFRPNASVRAQAPSSPILTDLIMRVFSAHVGDRKYCLRERNPTEVMAVFSDRLSFSDGYSVKVQLPKPSIHYRRCSCHYPRTSATAILVKYLQTKHPQGSFLRPHRC
mmetsp:Transcript_9460/g.14331  ORF Transcript_9460/g.14331 Transcript_9460/m.14331 type:complete len:141 (+) Transcript_9460:454-876(+)